MSTPEKHLSPLLDQVIIDFFTHHPPQRVRQHLRRLVLVYLQEQRRNGPSMQSEDLLWDMYHLFKLLAIATREMGDSTTDAETSSFRLA